MRIDYVRDSKTNYLRIESDTGCEDFQMRMIEENRIDGLLAISRKSLNGQEYYLYDISSLVSMEILFEGRMIGAENLIRIIDSLKKLSKKLEDYLLDLDGIVLRPDTVFISSDEQNIYYTYYSTLDSNFEDELKKLFEYIIKKLNHKDTRAVAIAYGIYKRICDGNINVDTVFDYEEAEEPKCEVIEEKIEVKDVLPQIAEEEREVADKSRLYIFYAIAGLLGMVFLAFFAAIFIERIRPGRMERTTNIAVCMMLGVAGYFVYNWYVKNKDSLVKIQHIRERIPYERTDVRIIVPKENERPLYRESEPEAEGTVLLGDTQTNAQHVLRWEQNGDYKRYDIVKEITVIGSAPAKSDCVINLPGVSRMHARISKVGEEYFIKDLNSTNGTSVNGRELACFEMCPIRRNDRILVGNIECVFV